MDYRSYKKWVGKFRICNENEQNPVSLRSSLVQITLQIEGIISPFLVKCTQFVVECDEQMEHRINADGMDMSQHIRKDIGEILDGAANPFTRLIVTFELGCPSDGP